MGGLEKKKVMGERPGQGAGAGPTQHKYVLGVYIVGARNTHQLAGCCPCLFPGGSWPGPGQSSGGCSCVDVSVPGTPENPRPPTPVVSQLPLPTPTDPAPPRPSLSFGPQVPRILVQVTVWWPWAGTLGWEVWPGPVCPPRGGPWLMAPGGHCYRDGLWCGRVPLPGRHLHRELQPLQPVCGLRGRLGRDELQ